jgi:two-component system NtrC family response regulator
MAEKADPSGSGDILTAALRLTASMVQQQDIVGLVRQGLELCMRVLDCDRALLILESDEGKREVVEAAGAAGRSAAYSTTALRLVTGKREPLLISDTIGDEVLSTQASISQNEIRSVLCSPLEAVDRSFPGKRAFLYLDSTTSRHPFSLADLEKFRLLSLLMGSLVKKSELLMEQEAAIAELRGKVEEKRFEDLIFASDSFNRQCLRLIEQGAPADVPILLVGETGTGKEMLARVVHKLSSRRGKPFIAVNCGAMPPSLIESQLFGHERGAFTGAVSSRKGCFEEASGGTLFLDEVGELPPQVQAHFLRALQEGEITRVGSSKPIKVDVRIVAATNIDLEQAVAQERFRKDLFFRLSVLPVKVPPVRERGEDALLLARFFLTRYADSLGRKDLRLSREAEKAILVYNWPGNVREIQNRIQRAVITAEESAIGTQELGIEAGKTAESATLAQAREAVDRELIANALQRAPGNLTNAAKILGIDRKSLRILLEKYGMDRGESQENG